MRRVQWCFAGVFVICILICVQTASLLMPSNCPSDRRIISSPVYSPQLGANVFVAKQISQERIFSGSQFAEHFGRGSWEWSSDNSAKRGRFARDLQYVRDRLAAPTVNRCLACAIVGNSGNIVGKNYGNTIDHHDIVFRLNNAPTISFEQDVGSKDTFRILTLETCAPEVVATSDTLVFIIGRPAHMNWIATNILGSEDLWAQRKFWRKSACTRAKFELPPGKLQIVHPDIMQWGFELVNINSTGGRSVQPSSGFIAILMALHYCKTVSLFGFSSPEHKSSVGKYHYYDKLDSTQADRDHNISTEQIFVERLVDAGAISRFT